MQLLTIKTMLAHHLIDELLGGGVIREIAAGHEHVVLRLQQKAS
ncbi:hypothetical protein GCM10011513_23460 [Franconibacter daqui]|nr:hypothetical protein GCM10011513_23460 [Franconibacter daqui]